MENHEELETLINTCKVEMDQRQYYLGLEKLIQAILY